MAFDYKAYYEANRERIRARNKDYYRRNRDRIRRHIDEYASKPETKAKRNARLRYRAKNDPQFRGRRAKASAKWRRGHMDQVRLDQRESAARKLALVRQTKKGKSCSRCPESDPVCLDYHHIDPKSKLGTVSRMTTKRVTDTAILAEIAKCEL